MKRWLLIAVSIVLASSLALGAYFLTWSHRTLIHNATDVPLTELIYSQTSLDGKWSIDRHIPLLPPGETITIRHGQNDTTAELRFTLAGITYKHSEGYIDLWTGESWVFDIQGDGTVKTGYAGLPDRWRDRTTH